MWSLNNDKYATKTYRKSTNSDTRLNWNAHISVEQKLGAPKNLMKEAKTICSNQALLEKRNETPTESIKWNQWLLKK